MVVEREVCHHLKFGWLVGKVLLCAEVVYTVAIGLVLLLQKLLDIGHIVPVQACIAKQILLQIETRHWPAAWTAGACDVA